MANDVALRGEVIEPSHVSEGVSFPAHDFFNVLRHLVLNGSAYRDQGSQHAALDAIDGYEAHVVPKNDQRHVTSESDLAGREDVTQRQPAQPGGIPVPASPTGPIDYDKLARALVAAQQSHQAQTASTEYPTNEPPAESGSDEPA